MQMKSTKLLDLIAAIDGERRFHQAAALLSMKPEDRAQYAHHARCEATAISRVRRNMVRTCAHPASLSRRRFDNYVDSLIETYVDGTAVGSGAHDWVIACL
jgi:hypothetical protein